MAAWIVPAKPRTRPCGGWAFGLRAGGIDLVMAWSSFRLTGGIENLTLMGDSDTSAFGNEFDNLIDGNAVPAPALAAGLYLVATPIGNLGDLAPLLAAFAVPNDPKWPGPCAAIGVIVPDVWLIDADGRAIRPGDHDHPGHDLV